MNGLQINYEQITADLQRAREAAERATNPRRKVTSAYWLDVYVKGANKRRMEEAAAKAGLTARGSAGLFKILAPANGRIARSGDGLVEVSDDERTVAGKEVKLMKQTLKRLGWREVSTRNGAEALAPPMQWSASAGSTIANDNRADRDDTERQRT